MSNVDSYVMNFKRFLKKIKEEYKYWTSKRSSEVIEQLNKLKEKAKQIVLTIEENVERLEENWNGKFDFDYTSINLKEVLNNFQDIIDVIEDVSIH